MRVWMGRVLFVPLSLVLLPSFASGGQIYGKLTRGGQPMPNTQVQLDCPAGTATAETDRFGSYQLYMAGTGRCTLTVENTQQNVYLYDEGEPVRYDFEVLQTPRGNQLRRR